MAHSPKRASSREQWWDGTRRSYAAALPAGQHVPYSPLSTGALLRDTLSSIESCGLAVAKAAKSRDMKSLRRAHNDGGSMYTAHTGPGKRTASRSYPQRSGASLWRAQQPATAGPSTYRTPLEPPDTSQYRTKRRSSCHTPFEHMAQWEGLTEMGCVCKRSTAAVYQHSQAIAAADFGDAALRPPAPTTLRAGRQSMRAPDAECYPRYNQGYCCTPAYTAHALSYKPRQVLIPAIHLAVHGLQICLPPDLVATFPH